MYKCFFKKPNASLLREDQALNRPQAGAAPSFGKSVRVNTHCCAACTAASRHCKEQSPPLKGSQGDKTGPVRQSIRPVYDNGKPLFHLILSHAGAWHRPNSF